MEKEHTFLLWRFKYGLVLKETDSQMRILHIVPVSTFGILCFIGEPPLSFVLSLYIWKIIC